MKIFYFLIALFSFLIVLDILPVHADDGYINLNAPNLGCKDLSGFQGQEIMIRNTMQHLHGYKVTCPTVSGSQIDLTWIPNSTRQISIEYPYNASLPFHVSSPNGTELNYALQAGNSVDLPIEFSLTRGYQMSYVKLSLSDVPQGVTVFINPNVSDFFSNNLDKDFVTNGTLHIYVDSATIVGNYDIKIEGEGSLKDPNGKEVDIKNSVDTLHLVVLPNPSKIWLKVGTPTIYQKIISMKMGRGSMSSGFGAETDVPVRIYANQKTEANLVVESYPQGAFYKFVPNTVVATSQGANATLIMVGAGFPNPDYPNAIHTDVARIVATTQFGNNTAVGFLPVFKGQDMTILHGPHPINLTNNNFGGNSASGFKMVGVIFDPPVGRGNTMQVSLSVLGIMNDTKVLPIPSWLQVNFPVPDFTLVADKPYFFVLNFTTQHEFAQPYPVAIDENIGGTRFTQTVWLPKESHVVFAPILSSKSPFAQQAAGTKISDIACKGDDYLLVDGKDRPACVMPNHLQRFLSSGLEPLATYLDKTVQHSANITQIILSDQDYAHNCTVCSATQKNITVTLGENNTVRWTDSSSAILWVIADKIGDNDTSFYRATFTPSGMHDNTILPNFIHPGRSFEFTFTKIGKFGWQSRPGLTGWVTVVPKVETITHIFLKDFKPSYMKNIVYLNHTLGIYAYPVRNPNIIHVANPSNQTFSDCHVVLQDNRTTTLANFDTVNASFYDQIWYNSTFTKNTEITFQCSSPPELVSYSPLGINPITFGELDRIHNVCERPIISENKSGTFITCPLAANITSWLHILPPVHQRTVCRGGLGCSGEYVYPLVGNSTDYMPKDSQKQLVDYVIKNLPQAAGWPQGWRLDSLAINFHPDGGAFATLQFVFPVENPNLGSCGWYGQVSVNLKDKKLFEEHNLVPKSDTPCQLK